MSDTVIRGGTPTQPAHPIDDDSSVTEEDFKLSKVQTTRSDSPWASPDVLAASALHTPATSPHANGLTRKSSAPEADPLDRKESWASHVSDALENIRSSSKEIMNRKSENKPWKRANSTDESPFPPWTTANMDDFAIIPERVKHKVLLVFLNPMSGGQLGRALIEKFRRFLNPIQVVDLSKDKPTKALEMYRCVAEEDNLVVVVCGGDGSAGWIMDSISQSYKGLHVPLGMLPLGTGNDLAQVLGWGAGHTLDDDLSKFLRRVHTSTTSLFDRWSVGYVRIRSPEDEKDKNSKQTAKEYIENSPSKKKVADSPKDSSPDKKEEEVALPALETRNWVMNNYMDISTNYLQKSALKKVQKCHLE